MALEFCLTDGDLARFPDLRRQNSFLASAN
jgi:hypothetical protein